MDRLNELSSKNVFKNFEAISKIPRCSGDEVKISEFIYDFGKKLGLETTRDSFGNVLIRKDATEDCKDKEGVIVQSHLDMVCEKTEESLHDFTCDPIELILEGDTIRANDTTLGADDGIGVAIAMALLEDENFSHPKLEMLFTTSEETGMDGALGLSDSLLEGKNLINVDNEEDWMIIVGCSGGINAYLEHDLNIEENNNLTNYKIEVKGLMGGHSGMMIDQARANAIKVLNSLLLKLSQNVDFSLQSINGGSKHNAIPSSAKATIGVKKEEINKLEEEINSLFNEVKDNYIKREINLELLCKNIDSDNKYIDDKDTKDILRLLQIFPHGVNKVDKELDIVRSSNNLAILKQGDNKIHIQTSIRSSNPDDLEELKTKVSDTAKAFNFRNRFSEGYPMWEPNFNNHLLEVAKETYKNMKESEPEVAVIHAGLENGILSQKYPDINMISVGPNIVGAHTPKEKLSVESTDFCFNFIKEIIKNL